MTEIPDNQQNDLTAFDKKQGSSHKKLKQDDALAQALRRNLQRRKLARMSAADTEH